ncbi:lactate racemase domain-containing protein [Planctomicrobium sp. SH661]|uniref:lactate racemase domain-containing protein n=1 Tax=Planctomicrobium sp. SH661 TaxID=3448124 RepID=UPI003F5C6863
MLGMPLPLMYRIRQTFGGPTLTNVEEATRNALASLPLQGRVAPGESVAITVGSRGIANIPQITREVVSHLRSLGAKPFIVTSMGSHGGATAEGQVDVLRRLGVTEESVGAEIRSTMETVVVAQTPQGIPVHFDRIAFEADHVIVMGRVKPHTIFSGEIESGLHKMMLIGLGNHTGATIYHQAIANHSFGTIVQSVAKEVLAKCRVLAGVGIVENAYDETAYIEAVLPDDFYTREVEMLKLAQGWMPRLPFSHCDLLIVDRMGKNISGSGMDTNVIGRKYNDHASTPGEWANCKRIFVRSLTPETYGNALGIGLAEFTTQRAVDQIDREYTRINCVTSSHVTAGMIPLVYPDDRSAIQDALKTVGLTPPENARVIQISDTLHLAEAVVSDAYMQSGEIAAHEVLSGPAPMEFDAAGMLTDVAG